MLARTTVAAASKQGAVLARTVRPAPARCECIYARLSQCALWIRRHSPHCCGSVTCCTFFSSPFAQIATQASVSNADGSYSFVKSRTAYRAEVAALRQEFITEVARRKEKLARDAEYVAACFFLPPPSL
jgi:hypothetical protein